MRRPRSAELAAVFAFGFAIGLMGALALVAALALISGAIAPA